MNKAKGNTPNKLDELPHEWYYPLKWSHQDVSILDFTVIILTRIASAKHPFDAEQSSIAHNDKPLRFETLTLTALLIFTAFVFLRKSNIFNFICKAEFAFCFQN